MAAIIKQVDLKLPTKTLSTAPHTQEYFQDQIPISIRDARNLSATLVLKLQEFPLHRN